MQKYTIKLKKTLYKNMFIKKLLKLLNTNLKWFTKKQKFYLHNLSCNCSLPSEKKEIFDTLYNVYFGL